MDFIALPKKELKKLIRSKYNTMDNLVKFVCLIDIIYEIESEEAKHGKSGLESNIE